MKVLGLSKLNLLFLALFIGLLPPHAFAQQQNEPTKEAAKAFAEGMEAYDKGDYNTAIDRFTVAIKLDPTYSDAYYRRAFVRDGVPWLNRGERTGDSDYTLAIKFNPNNADAYLRRGLRLKGKSAIDDFDKAILLRPDFTEAYYQRSLARSQSYMYWLRRLHSGKLRPDELKYYAKDLGIESEKKDEVVAYLLNQIRSAIPDLIKSTELNPQHVEAYLHLARVYSILEERNNAVAAATKVLAITPDNADAYYERGIAHLESKQYEKANQDFTDVIRLRPNHTRAYGKRVIARFYLNDLVAALKDYVAVLRLKPNELREGLGEEEEVDGVPMEPENFDRVSPGLAGPVRASLADAYYHRALSSRYGWDRLEDRERKAVTDLNRASTLHPSHVAASYEKGLALSNLELHAEAVRAFSDVIRIQPQNPEAYYARGVALHKLKLNRRALHDLSRSIELSPKFTKAFFERAQVYLELGDPRRAVADVTTAITIYSEFTEAYYLRGLAHEARGENQKATADYLEVVRLAYPDEKTESNQTERLGPKLATVYHRGVARLYLARLLGDDDRVAFPTRSEEIAIKNYLESAERDFTHVISAKPKFQNAYRQRGRAREIERVSYFGKGSTESSLDKKGALADFAKAIELDSRYIDAYLSRAKQFHEAYEPEEAIRDYKRVVELDPTNAEAFYGLGINHAKSTDTKQEDLKAAVENFSLAIKANPGYVDAYFDRAFWVAEEEPLRALADYTQIIQLDPENVKAYRQRAALYKRLKDYRSALADYTRAIEIEPSEPGANNRYAAITYAERAYVRYDLGDGKGAVEDYLHALRIRPCLYCTSGSSSVSQAKKADAFFQKGLALLRRGDKEASRQNLEEAARLFYTQGDMPKYQSVKYHLSRF